MNKNYLLYTIGVLILITNISGAFFGASRINLGIFSNYGSMLTGVIPFCLSFFLFNIYTNQYGISSSKKLVLLITLIRITGIACLFVLIKSHVVTNEYFQITLLTLIAGAIASLVALNLNCYVFMQIYNFFDGKQLWIRCLVSIAIGELIYSLISNTVFLFFLNNTSEILSLSLHNYTFKILFEFITLPVTYLLVYFLSSKETKGMLQ
jgi:uncharacterized PurR-regulated membrane protein YhhQ (DUF165 family)